MSDQPMTFIEACDEVVALCHMAHVMHYAALGLATYTGPCTPAKVSLEGMQYGARLLRDMADDLHCGLTAMPVPERPL